jgi:hypothetical protein
MIREIDFMKTLGKHDNLLIMVSYVKDPENPVIASVPKSEQKNSPL